MEPYIESKSLSKYVLRMSKDFTSFFYFTLESNENICFYSTMPFEKGQSYRDIVVHCTPELEEHFQNVLQHLSQRTTIELISQEIVSDGL